MPIYEYRCGGCGHQDDFLEKVGAPSLRKCPSCGRRSFRRLVSLSSFHLKGDGWYVTDFRDGGKGKRGADGASANGDGAPKAGSGDVAPKAGSGEAAPKAAAGSGDGAPAGKGPGGDKRKSDSRTGTSA